MSQINEGIDPTCDTPSSGGGAGTGTQQLRKTAQQVGEDLRNLENQARHVASEYYEQGIERARQCQQDLEHYVQEQPIKSLLIAAGIGMFLGVLWRR